ncbi:MAG: hypothetical protein MHPDNHAH_03011 [Anaerolineales bacterium]|nr:hypothetical protein [Anaerolineales bacterium]WKZ48653.1 MAG: hypothetical protein QY306_04680 [Anaerolineales bacterium]
MEVERIKFERTGGFANMRLAADLDLHDLSDEQAVLLRSLLDELDFPELPAKLISDNSMPDQFTYTITVEAEKWQHTVITGDAPEDEKMQELLELLNRLARKQLKKH